LQSLELELDELEQSELDELEQSELDELEQSELDELEQSELDELEQSELEELEQSDELDELQQSELDELEKLGFLLGHFCLPLELEEQLELELEEQLELDELEHFFFFLQGEQEDDEDELEHFFFFLQGEQEDEDELEHESSQVTVVIFLTKLLHSPQSSEEELEQLELLDELHDPFIHSHFFKLQAPSKFEINPDNKVLTRVPILQCLGRFVLTIKPVIYIGF